VEPKVAAQIFEQFLNGYFDLSVTLHEKEYYFKPIGEKEPNPKSIGCP